MSGSQFFAADRATGGVDLRRQCTCRACTGGSATRNDDEPPTVADVEETLADLAKRIDDLADRVDGVDPSDFGDAADTHPDANAAQESHADYQALVGRLADATAATDTDAAPGASTDFETVARQLAGTDG